MFVTILVNTDRLAVYIKVVIMTVSGARCGVILIMGFFCAEFAVGIISF